MGVSIARAERMRIPRRGHPSGGSRFSWRSGRVTELASFIGGIVAWEVFGRLLHLQWLPPFSACVAALIELNKQGLIVNQLIDSVQALAIGFVAALLSSLVLALLMAEFELVNQAVGGYVYALFLLPAIALVPVFLAVFGIGNLSRLAVIYVYCFFFMTINFHTAFSQRDAALEEMAESFQASRWQRIRYLVIPMALPVMMATIRVGLSRAVKGMINGEQFIALFGLGGLVATFGGQFAADKVFAVILVIVALALVLDVVTRILDARWTRWAAA
jgi:NitT/TauT family transport system permease protein